jgi:hypothetical protein
MKQLPRACAQYTRRYSTAQLSTPDHKTELQVKLCSDGLVVIGIVRDGKVYRRELSPDVEYQD